MGGKEQILLVGSLSTLLAMVPKKANIKVNKA